MRSSVPAPIGRERTTQRTLPTRRSSKDRRPVEASIIRELKRLVVAAGEFREQYEEVEMSEKSTGGPPWPVWAIVTILVALIGAIATIKSRQATAPPAGQPAANPPESQPATVTDFSTPHRRVFRVVGEQGTLQKGFGHVGYSNY